MNLYVVDGGEVVSGGFGYEPPEHYRALGVFAAETPAQAKYDAMREFVDNEWTSLRVRLAYRDVDAKRGVWADEWPEGPWIEDDSIDPPEPHASVGLTINAILEARP